MTHLLRVIEETTGDGGETGEVSCKSFLDEDITIIDKVLHHRENVLGEDLVFGGGNGRDVFKDHREGREGHRSDVCRRVIHEGKDVRDETLESGTIVEVSAKVEEDLEGERLDPL